MSCLRKSTPPPPVSWFPRAKQLITLRERREKLTASRPQAYYGSAIRAYWKQVEATRPRLGNDRAEGQTETRAKVGASGPSTAETSAPALP